ncbi:MAG: polyprenol phosphomannose-dependent alpha 1,6 mannosyltransferase MptB [Propionibacteriaceae bacterium]|nr:polyprenol phosphomannose-dependent alpha 1,6 mannosyltransferase MptB [Propionibacteriaceae bacterium]
MSVTLRASGFRTSVGAAWAEFPVKIGLLGTAIIAIGSLTPAYLPQASPIWPVLRSLNLAGEFGRVAGTVLTVSGIFLLVDAWFRLRHEIYARLNPLVIIGLWSLPFLVSPPILSHDAYSYDAQGWMIHNGQNPYDGGPTLVPGLFTDYAPWQWRYTPAPYGPLGLQIAHLVVDLSGGHPWLAALLIRIPALIGVTCIVHFLPKIARRIGADEHQVIWFACLNPLLVIDYVGGAHNDAWMMGLVVVSLWLALKPGWWPLAAVAIGVGASIKQPAILGAVFLPLLAHPIPSWRDLKRSMAAIGKAVVSLGIAAGVFVVISIACGLGFGWLDALGVPGTIPSASPSYGLGALLQLIIAPGGTSWLNGTMRVVLVLGVLLMLYWILRYGLKEPWKALSWSWLTVALSASALHSWYLLWGGLILPLSTTKRKVPWPAIAIVIFMLGYAALNMGNRNGVWAVLAAAVCMVAWLSHIAVYHRLWPGLRQNWVSHRYDRQPDTPPAAESSGPNPKELP